MAAIGRGRSLKNLRIRGRNDSGEENVPLDLTRVCKNKSKCESEAIFNYTKGEEVLMNYEPFLDWIVMCEEKWMLYNSQRQPAQWLDQEEAPKHFQKPNMHQNGSWSLFGGLLASLIHFSFLNPSETITSEKYAQQINEMN